jgi:hypothetical protein
MPNDELSKVAEKTRTAESFSRAAALPRTLLSGTTGMRAAAGRYLPRNPAEHPEQYERRLKSTFLFNAFERSLQMLSGKVFSEPVKLDENVPDEIVEWSSDIDLEGRDLSTFAEDWLYDSVAVGMCHVLVDMQRADLPDGVVPTLEEERRMGMRPYLSIIPADTVLGWRTERSPNGIRLSQIRIAEEAEVADGKWGSKYVDRVRVITAGDLQFEGERDEPRRYTSFELYEKRETGKLGEQWELVDRGLMKPFVEIPLVTHYTGRTGFMTAKPPLQDLAWKNVEHWQSGSEQRNTLHTGRIPILFGSGFKNEERRSKKIIGTLVGWFSGGDSARLSYVETSGRASDAGFKDLEMLREEMSIMSMQPLLQRASGNETATSKAIDTAAADNRVQAWAITLGMCLAKCFDYMSVWAALEGDDAGGVQVNTEFGIAELDRSNLESAIKARAMGDISRETLWDIFDMHGVFFDSWTPETEAERIRIEQDNATPENLNFASFASVAAGEEVGVGEEGAA